MADMVELLQAENRTLSQRASDFSEKVKALDQKVRRLDAQARAGVRAIEERDGFKAKLRRAEKAQAAAERVVEKERSARMHTEAELEELKARIVQVQEQPSRLAVLREELDL